MHQCEEVGCCLCPPCVWQLLQMSMAAINGTLYRHRQVYFAAIFAEIERFLPASVNDCMPKLAMSAARTRCDANQWQYSGRPPAGGPTSPQLVIPSKPHWLTSREVPPAFLVLLLRTVAASSLPMRSLAGSPPVIQLAEGSHGGSHGPREVTGP